jgi:hypothetical protein
MLPSADIHLPPLPHLLLPQTLRFTKDVDPYYKLALLSYRSKLENAHIAQVSSRDSRHGSGCRQHRRLR